MLPSEKGNFSSPNSSPDIHPAELYLKDMNEEQLHDSIFRFGVNWSEQEKGFVEDACHLAKVLFRDDRYRNDSGIYHLLRVVNRVVGYLEKPDWELTVAAILHDAIEDHPEGLFIATRTFLPEDLSPKELQEYAVKLLKNRYSDRVGDTVAAVTNPPLLNKKNYSTEEEFLDAYAHKVEQAVVTPDGWIIKFADWCDNGLGLNFSEPGFKGKEGLTRKYGKVLPILETRFEMSDIQDSLSESAKVYVRQQFEFGHRRLIVPASDESSGE